jgi:hypothetical protein
MCARWAAVAGGVWALVVVGLLGLMDFDWLFDGGFGGVTKLVQFKVKKEPVKQSNQKKSPKKEL